MKYYADFMKNHTIMCLTVNLKWASINELGKFTFSNIPIIIHTALKKYKFLEFVIVQKCNCVELYCVSTEKPSETREKMIELWTDKKPGMNSNLLNKIKTLKGEKVFRHLIETACGIKSLQIGDAQVLGQIRNARLRSSKLAGLGPIFGTLFTYARTIDVRIRNETEFHNGYTSIERAVCEIIDQKYPKSAKITIVGTGETGRLLIKSLTNKGFMDITALNRTVPKTENMINESKIIIKSLRHLSQTIVGSDIIIFATSSPNYLLTEKEKNLIGDKAIVIDVGNPQNVDPTIHLPNYVSLDHIHKLTNTTIRKRQNELTKVKNIIQSELKKLESRINESLINQKIRDNIRNFNHGNNGISPSLLKLRSKIFEHVRGTLQNNEFTEVHTPAIMTISTDPVKNPNEERFEVNWYGKKAFLRQSVQLHKQMLVISKLKKIYEIGMFWRAEKTRTPRHISEAWGLDVEMRGTKSHEEVMDCVESLVNDVFNKLNNDSNKLIRMLKVNVPNLTRPFLRITYDEAVRLLQENGIRIEYGDDIGYQRELDLYKIMESKHGRRADLFFIHSYPGTVKKFYTKPFKNGLTQTFDLIFRGWELCSGAQRETNYARMVKRMKESGLDPKKYKFYLDMFANNKVPQHGGFGLGLDRFVARIINTDDVSKTIPFPRTQYLLAP